MGAELTHHLEYEKGEAKPEDNSENHRNGSSRKRIATDDDMLELNIPGDRNGTFDPVLIAKASGASPTLTIRSSRCTRAA